MQRSAWIRALVFVGVSTFWVPFAGAQEDAEDRIRIREVQIGTHLASGRVADPTSVISRSAGRIYAVIRLNNPSREATSVRVALEPEGARRRGFSLDIPARPRYRTVARFISRHPPGRYRIVIRTEDGIELQRVSLTITD